MHAVLARQTTDALLLGLQRLFSYLTLRAILAALTALVHLVRCSARG